MTLNEIKVEVLKLMEPDTYFNTDDLETYENDDNYKGYLGGMLGSINRAIRRVSNVNKLPYKYYTKTYSTKDTNNRVINLTSEITDYKALVGVLFNNKQTTYNLVGSSLNLPKTTIGDYTIVYKPKPPVITASTTDDLASLGVPDEVCEIIPYFVKADLLHEVENRVLSTEARNFFEAYLDDIEEPAFENQAVVEQWLY